MAACFDAGPGALGLSTGRTGAQAIVSDSYVDFRATKRVVAPDETAHVTLLYPWVEGESYDVELLLSPTGAVEYEIEDAEAAS